MLNYSYEKLILKAISTPNNCSSIKESILKYCTVIGTVHITEVVCSVMPIGMLHSVLIPD